MENEIPIFLPKRSAHASINLQRFVKLCRDKLTVFGANLDFEAFVWDVTDSLNLKGHGAKRTRLTFCSYATRNAKVPIPLAEPFCSFAKAYVRYSQGLRPTKNPAFRLAALRALEASLTESGNVGDPSRVNAFVLNRAAQLIDDDYKETTAYRIGSQLEMLARFLCEHYLLEVRYQWVNPIVRPKDTVRVGKEFDDRRNKKLPSEAALDALPKIFHLATVPGDVLYSATAAILCAAPDRINEVLLLQNECEVFHTSKEEGASAYGLRWWPAKGAEPTVKWIVSSMVNVVQTAISRIRAATDKARRIAKWYEERPTELYLEDALEELRTRRWLSVTAVAEILGIRESAAYQFCSMKGIESTQAGVRRLYSFASLEQCVVSLLPPTFPYLNVELGLKYSEALFVAQRNVLHNQRGTYQCMIEDVTINQMNDALGARVAYGFPSIFSRLGFTEPNGLPIKVTTHQFRHYLNTLAQVGGLSQLDIAKWSGRSDIRHNSSYDHVTSAELINTIRTAVGETSKMFGPLAELPKRMLIPRDEFARLKIPTAHVTEIGFCIHDYTMSPCELHRDCINCAELVCVKGDEARNNSLQHLLNEAQRLLEAARKADHDGQFGAGRWHEHHMTTVERLMELCAIIADPTVPLGSVIQLSPIKDKHNSIAGRSKEIRFDNPKRP